VAELQMSMLDSVYEFVNSTWWHIESGKGKGKGRQFV